MIYSLAELSDECFEARLTNDPLLRDYFSLTDVQLRSQKEPASGIYMAESPKVISRAIAAGHVPKSLLALAEWLGPLKESLAPYPEVTVFTASKAQLERITGFHLHRGALATMQRPQPLDPAQLLSVASLVVIIEDVVDHTNVGAIFRSAAALGADAVLVTPRCADPLYRRSVRVSMGAVLELPWARLPGWDAARELVKGQGFTIAGLSPHAGALTLAQFVATRPEKVAIVFGTEGAGLSRAALDSCDVSVMIPMSHGIDSLNVAAASAVTIYALAANRGGLG